MKAGIVSFYFLILLLCSHSAEAQNYSTKGTDFWLGFMDNLASDDPGSPVFLYLYVSADQIAQVNVSIPLGTYNNSFTVPANNAVEVGIPTSEALVTSSQLIENKGIRITSDVPVTVYCLNYKATSSDAAIILPRATLGSEYIVTTFEPFSTTNPSEMLIAALEDNTQLEIIPTASSLSGSPPGSPVYVTLNRGQVYQFQSMEDLSGTYIHNDPAAESCHNFAVYSGNVCAYVPINCGFCDHLVQQMFPLSSWGKKYVTVPLATRFRDLFRIIASEDSTFVSIDGSPPILLQRAEVKDTLLVTESLIEADKPISISQFSRGGTCDGVLEADPFMILLSPLEQSINKITFNSFTSTLINSYFLNIITPTSNTSTLKLDSLPVGAGSFLPVTSDPGYSYAQLNISPGNHTLEADSGFTAYVYGYGNFESYGYIAGANINKLDILFEIITAGGSQLYYEFYDTLKCNTSIQFSGLDNEDVLTWNWDFGNGTIDSGQYVIQQFEEEGTYWIKLITEKSGGCGTDTITWPVHIRSVLSGLPEDTSVCPNNSIILEIDSTLDVVWSNGEITPSLEIGAAGIYWADVTDGECQIIDTIIVREGEVPQPLLPEDPVVCPEIGSILFLDPGNFSSYNWLDGQTDSLLFVFQQGLYGVEVTNQDGCSAYTETNVEIDCPAQLIVPNVFTPNSDGRNDIFKIYSKELSFFEIKIFNRWGEVVYESRDISDAWDGRSGGKDQETGTYLWLASYRDARFPEFLQKQKGDLTLIR